MAQTSSLLHLFHSEYLVLPASRAQAPASAPAPAWVSLEQVDWWSFEC